ncbi:MAG: hypothetical protein AB1765_04580 [Candidatus Hydrogenedentota bacterium]
MSDYFITCLTIIIVLFSSFRIGSRFLTGFIDSIFLGLGILSLSFFLVFTVAGVNIFSSLFVIILAILCGENQPVEKIEIDCKNHIMIVIIIIISIGFLLGFLLSSTPAIFYDNLKTHTGIPWQYVIEKKIVNNPHDFVSGYPQNNEMILTAILAFIKEPRVAKILNIFFLLLFFAGIINSLKIFSKDKSENLLFAVIVSGLTVFTCGIFESGVAGKNEVLLIIWIFYTVKYIVCFLKSNDIKKLIFASVFMGLALGTKYTSFIILPGIIISMFMYNFKSHRLYYRFFYIILFLGIVGFVFMPWLIKNAIYYSNPFYPFFTSVFDSSPVDYSTNYTIIQFGFKKYLLLIPGILLNLKGFGSFDDIGYHYLFSLIIIFWQRKMFKETWYLWIIIFITFMCWSIFEQIKRHIFSILPLWNIIIFIYVSALLPTKPFFKIATFIFMLFIVLNIGKIIYFEQSIFNRLDPLSGKISYRNYLKLYVDYENIAKYISSRKDNKTILLIGELRRVYFKNPIIVGSEIETPIIKKIIQSDDYLNELVKYFKNNNIGYIYVNKWWVDRLNRCLDYFKLTSEEQEHFSKFLIDYFDLIFQDNNRYLYVIKTDISRR